MTNPPPTRSSLLARIRDAGDREAWRQFVGLYAPLVYNYGRRKGLQDADAADLTQEVLRAVSASVGQLDYDVERGSFRGWLFTIAHHRLFDLKKRLCRVGYGSGDTGTQILLNEQPAPDDEAQWNREYRQRVFAWAAEQVRGDFQPNTWQAFWQTAVEGKSGKDVGRDLGLTVAAVYLAKSRVMARLKEQIGTMDERKD